MAGLTSAIPGIMWLSAHKNTLFVLSGVLMAFSTALWWQQRGAPCPLDPIKAAACSRFRRINTWLLSGAWFAYHLLRLPLLRTFDFYAKVDTDVMFVAPMPDLGGLLAARPAAQLAHTGLQPSTDCERGIMQSLRRFEAHSNSSSLSAGCTDPISHIFFGNLLVFRTAFMTSR